jgi:hypothetical protein
MRRTSACSASVDGERSSLWNVSFAESSSGLMTMPLRGRRLYERLTATR